MKAGRGGEAGGGGRQVEANTPLTNPPPTMKESPQKMEEKEKRQKEHFTSNVPSELLRRAEPAEEPAHFARYQFPQVLPTFSFGRGREK